MLRVLREIGAVSAHPRGISQPINCQSRPSVSRSSFGRPRCLGAIEHRKSYEDFCIDDTIELGEGLTYQPESRSAHEVKRRAGRQRIWRHSRVESRGSKKTERVDRTLDWRSLTDPPSMT